jgi:glycosyltransferase involved in cell wall biosynthesis
MRRGIDRRLFAQPDGPAFPEFAGRPRVVFVGRVVRAKGVETLVAATALARTPGLQVLLVGDGPERPYVERLARRHGVADRVHVTGFVSHKRIPAVLRSADLIVLPSFYEELGTVLIEAMQVGVPAVATRVGGIPELVEHGTTGLLVEPGEPAALAAAIDTILADRELARRLGANAMRRAPEYDMDRLGAQVHGLYERVLEEWPARR